MRRAVIMADGNKITPEDLEMTNAPNSRFERMTLKEARDALEKELTIKALARNSNNLSKTAIELGISRPTLYDLLEKFGIPRE
jgi:two-component system NtrC family response regulator